MDLVTADEATREHIMDGTYPIWGEGLSREAYSRWNRGQMATEWGREHLRRVALVNQSGVLASAKRYDFQARVNGQVTDVPTFPRAMPTAPRLRSNVRPT